MGSKQKTKTSSSQQATTTNSLPSWLTSPYQQAVTQAGQIAAQPAVSQGTQASIDATRAAAQFGNVVGGNAAWNLSNIASGNFGNPTLTGTAAGTFTKSNPWVSTGNPVQTSGALSGLANNGLPTQVSSALNGYTADGRPAQVSSALNGYTLDGRPISVSGALSGFAGNGGLNTGYIDQSGLNKTASGAYLTADSNPYIRGVADEGADAAQARINAQFGAAGRSNGSGLYADLFGKGIAQAANDVYYQNYSAERDRQQGAQGTLLNAQQTARESALARQFGAANSIFGAQNSAAEAAAGRAYGASGALFGAQNASAADAAARAYGASGALFGAQNSSAENAASRQAAARSQQYAGENAAKEAAAGRASSAYEAERQRQQAAASGLLSSQLTASGQLPGLLSQIMSGNLGALQAGQYGDQAALSQLGKYASILSGLAAPYGTSNSSGTSKGTSTTSGNLVSTLAPLAGSALAGWASGGFK